MSAPAARALVRQSVLRRSTQLRHASTTSEAANAASQTAAKAKGAAENATSKASQGLTKVTSSASGALSKAGPAIGTALGGIGGRTGRLIGAVQSLIPPTLYYSRVVGELAKTVYHSQKMQPPTTAQFQQYFNPLINLLRNPSRIASAFPSFANPQQYLQSVRNLSSQQLTTFGIIAAEVIGFFTVGEMIGRLKIVGYYGGHSQEHH